MHMSYLITENRSHFALLRSRAATAAVMGIGGVHVRKGRELGVGSWMHVVDIESGLT